MGWQEQVSQYGAFQSLPCSFGGKIAHSVPTTKLLPGSTAATTTALVGSGVFPIPGTTEHTLQSRYMQVRPHRLHHSFAVQLAQLHSRSHRNHRAQPLLPLGYMGYSFITNLERHPTGIQHGRWKRKSLTVLSVCFVVTHHVIGPLQEESTQIGLNTQQMR
jgi:hypothetical protein